MHPDAGLLTFTSIEMEIPAVGELRIVVNTPHDADTWTRLPLTRRHRSDGASQGPSSHPRACR